METRSSLGPPRFAALRPGSIRARGWLHEQLRLSADGLTGRMMDIWPDVGPDSAWLGGSGESWERGPYYARGLVALADALGDRALFERARRWIEWSLASQRPDGCFGPGAADDWWARMPMLDALRWHADATGDARVAPFLSRYFQFQHAHLHEQPLALWAKPRGGDNLDSVFWLHRHTGAHHLLGLADLLFRQSSDWIGELGGDGPPSEEFDFGHGVNRAQGFKFPAVWYQRSRNPAHLAALRHGWERIMAHHGQIHGLYSGDELLHGRGSTQGTELCTVVELLSSFETALRISGEAWLGDAIERIAYNALPAMLSPDHRGHQYFQLPNQVECTPGARAFWVPHDNDLLFGPATGFGCCAANFHMGWPRFVQHLWLAAPDGLAAPLLAPCEVMTRVHGQPVRIVEETEYPFGEEVHFTVRVAQPVAFAFHVRVPAWAANWGITTGGSGLCPAQRRPGRPPLLSASNGFVRIERVWNDGDSVTLNLPMPVRCSHWERGSIGIERGPLVFALRIGEDWRPVAGTAPFCDYELRPTSAWNYALTIDPATPERWLRTEHRRGAAQPWAHDGSPVTLRAPARRVPAWTMQAGVSGPIPEAPFATDQTEDEVTLIPFGCARLRIAMFPHLR
jgi:hypothetical protein